MSDYISRESVLNTIEDMDKALDTDRTVEEYKALLIECIKVLPSRDIITELEKIKEEIKKLEYSDFSYNDVLPSDEVSKIIGKHISKLKGGMIFMGYRPTISCPSCGKDCWVELPTKFYGYIDTTNPDLKSIKWLINNNKVQDPDMEFFGNSGPIISFSSDEFIEFIKLYEDDVNKYYEFVRDKPFKIEEEWNSHLPRIVYPFNDILNNSFQKVIEWG